MTWLDRALCAMGLRRSATDGRVRFQPCPQGSGAFSGLVQITGQKPKPDLPQLRARRAMLIARASKQRRQHKAICSAELRAVTHEILRAELGNAQGR